MQTETTTSFLDDLLADVEKKENQNTQAYNDLIAMEVIKLENEITANFQQAEVECNIINEWALKRNSAIQERVNLLRLKLESFIRGQGVKTIDLPHAVLKIRKQPDKVEVVDLQAFICNASSELVTLVPESVKPSLTKIKNYMQMTGKVPAGCVRIEGKEEFKLTLRTTSEEKE